MRPPVILNIHQSYVWTIFARFHEFVSLCQLLQMQMLLENPKDCVKLVHIFLLGSKLTPAKQEESSRVCTIKKHTLSANKEEAYSM